MDLYDRSALGAHEKAVEEAENKTMEDDSTEADERALKEAEKDRATEEKVILERDKALSPDDPIKVAEQHEKEYENDPDYSKVFENNTKQMKEEKAAEPKADVTSIQDSLDKHMDTINTKYAANDMSNEQDIELS